MPQWTPRHDLACTRLRSILRNHIVATDRILEQKISDAGPNNQRIDPHILTEARQSLVKRTEIIRIHEGQTPWYHLATTPRRSVQTRLDQLRSIHQKTLSRSLTGRIGQCLEIAVYRGLMSQTYLEYFGAFTDLDNHDDSTTYSKEEPPSTVSGRRIPDGKRLDFLIRHPESGYAGIEVKNIRNWMYPGRSEIAEFISKCCALDAVPVLIARRIHYSTFSVLNPCGVILHQSFNQLYPNSAEALATDVRNKNLLGYHDVRVGNEPDARLLRFLHDNLPKLLPTTKKQFEQFKDLLCEYANGEHSYESFAARVRRRSQGLPEDFPESEPDPSDWDFS